MFVELDPVVSSQVDYVELEGKVNDDQLSLRRWENWRKRMLM